MKALGTENFKQKKYKLLHIKDTVWRGFLGQLELAFMCIVYGLPGQGKTELLMKMAKFLCGFGKVEWWSYEQRHGYDLFRAIERNNMEEVSGKIMFIDPLSNLKGGDNAMFDELYARMKRRNSAQFYFIDSLDYTGFTFDQYKKLKEDFPNKAIVWIAHAENKRPDSKVGIKIERDGGFSIYVDKFIATPKKNRFGGYEPYIIWEERARLLNPLFFGKQDGPKKRGPKPKLSKFLTK